MGSCGYETPAVIEGFGSWKGFFAMVKGNSLIALSFHWKNGKVKVLLGVGKGAVFGFIVAFTGCLRGMQCGNNAAAVGDATTKAVVSGITAIIASDGIFAVICNALHI